MPLRVPCTIPESLNASCPVGEVPVPAQAWGRGSGRPERRGLTYLRAWVSDFSWKGFSYTSVDGDIRMAHMAKKQLGAIDRDLIARIDKVRGDVPRIKWVERALEQKLVYDALERTAENIPPTAMRAVMADERERQLKKASEKSSLGAAAFKCPAGHGIVEGAGPKGRCACNRPVVPA